MNWTQPDGIFLAVFGKKVGKEHFFRPELMCAADYSTDGNAAAADSTAALSFASMVKMLQSIAAVKTTAKREVLVMAWFLSMVRKKGFQKVVFKNWMPVAAFFLAQGGNLLQNRPDRTEIRLKNMRNPAIL